LQATFFHKIEKIGLDIGKPPKVGISADFCDFLGYRKFNRLANRRNCCIFLTGPKQSGPPVSRQPENAFPKWDGQPS
jgi:hypothetical protein